MPTKKIRPPEEFSDSSLPPRGPESIDQPFEEPSTPQLSVIKLIFWILVIVGIIWLVVILVGIHNASSPSGFSAVYLSSGDILVGKLSLSTEPTLTDVWLVTHPSSTNMQGQIALVPFKTTSISPDDVVHINPQQILYWANLNPDSAIVKELRAQ